MVLTRSGLTRLLGAVYKAKQIRSDWDSPGLEALVCQELFSNTILGTISSQIDTVSQHTLFSDIVHFCCLGRNASFTQQYLLLIFL